MDPVQQAELWIFIRDAVWISVATYVGVLVLAAARDITRQQLAKMHYEPSRVFSLRTWRRKISSTYGDTRGFFYVELFRFLSNLIVCGIYVYSTYRRQVSNYIALINHLFGFVFALDIIFGTIFASSAVLFIFSYARFLQVFSLPSLFLARGNSAFLHFGFLRAFSAYDSYIRMERRMVLLPFAPKKFAFRLFFQCLTLFYVLAAGIQMLEIPGDLLDAKFVELNPWNFFNCIYYVIVTLSTVGYGDISPNTIQGRVYTIFMIIIGIIVFTNIIGEIVAETRRQRGDGSYSDRMDTRHVIVSGTPTLDDLVHFVTEFYADPRHSNENCVIVVLVGKPKWTDIEWYRHVARNHFLQNHIIYLVGELRSSGDLERAGINTADAVFILTSPASSGDPSNQDSQTVMSALAIRNVRTDLPIYSQTLLDDSNTQISVAMKTPRFHFPEPDLLHRSKMDKSAMYRGIYEDTLRLERENLPAAFRVRESVDATNANDVRQEGTINPRSYKTDLERSEFVCLQQLYSALLVANIKANGVGTLCTNMYLDNPDNYHGPQADNAHGPSTARWLQEYHLGAACSITHAIIPESLDGVRIDKVACLLFRRGIIVVGTQKRDQLTVSTVLTTETELVAGDLGLFLTYLDIKHISTALHLVGHEYAMHTHYVICRIFKQQREIPEQILVADTLRRKRSRRQASLASLPAFAIKYQVDRTPRTRKSYPYSRGMRLEDSKYAAASQSFEFGSVARPELDHYPSSDGPLDNSILDFPSSFPVRQSRSSPEFPEELSDHVIVAMEGRTPLENLPFFLKLLWHKDERRAEIGRPNVPVVVIHPHVPKEVREIFREVDGKSLFFVSGSPAARHSWNLASLSTARSVATMADYTQEAQVSDGRTVYTLLTLDAMTTPKQNLFICSELIDEQSLELLREPSHPRRRGARLGNPFLRHSASTAAFTPNAPNSDDEEHLSEENDESGKKDEVTNNVDAETSTPTAPTPPGPPVAAMYDSDDFDSECTSTASVPASVKEEVCATNALFSSPITNGVDMDQSKRPGASRAKREKLFARFRFTSGELLVHSTADTLLVREYAEPGFVKFITGLVGADSSSPGQKIRLVRIPKSLFREYNLMNGQRLVEYGIVFERLVALGVTPLGLYRSGDAPARLPKSKRSKRGNQVIAEAGMINVPLGTKTPKRKVIGMRPIKALVRHGQDVLPNNVLQRRGQKELLGAVTPQMGAPNWAKKNVSSDVASTRSEKKQEAVPAVESQDESINGGPPDPTDSNTSQSLPAIGPVKRPSRVVDDFHDLQPMHDVEGNLLPYVYTMPDINTLVAETDGVYILCDPLFELPRNWPRPRSDSPTGVSMPSDM